jgi:subtilisin family serine protease
MGWSSGRRRRFGVAMVSMAAVGAAISGPPSAAAGRPEDPGPPEARRFIVTLREGTDPAAVAREHAAALGAEVEFVYQHALKGYAATFQGSGASAVARDLRVASVEPDGEMHTVTTQTGATWGLDRVDQRNLPLSGTFTYTNTGANVTAYIIDTGIRLTHAEFGGRAVKGFDAITPAADDCNGHGTHVAGTVGGSTFGVAKGVNLVAVRVLNCAGSGTNSQVIAGIDWVTGHHQPGAPAVANMSLGGGASAATDAAVRNSIARGVSYAIAAGNGFFGLFAQNACNSSPARVSDAMTVSATDRTDRKASWANFGNCVDWFAPGIDITSAWSTSDTATSTISGTSMATPHTAGVAALYLQSNPGASPEAVRAALFAATTKAKVTAANTVNNHLLFTNY